MDTATIKKVLLQKVTDIATLPFVVRKLMSTLSDPKSTAKDLGFIISSDQALSARVLRLVNSAFYGFANEITSIKHAVTVLGYDALRNLSLTIGSHSAFFKGEGGGAFNRKDLWLHSLGTGICARVLARHFSMSNTEEFFSAGLIHDVGKVIMDQYTPELFRKVINLTQKNKISFYEAEKITIGLTHPVIGQAAGEKWRFPSFLIDAIMYHHEPSQAGSSWEAATIIHLANYLCKVKQIGKNGDSIAPVIDPSVQQAINIDARAMELIYAEIDKDFKNSSAFIDMM